LTDHPTTEIDNPNMWKSTPQSSPYSTPSICNAKTFDDQSIEAELKKFIVLSRGTKATEFHDGIGNALRPLLYSYEQEKLNGSCLIWSANSISAAEQLLPNKASMKLFPLCVNSIIPKQMMNKIHEKHSDVLQTPNASKIILTTHTFPYSEAVFSTWIIFGVIV
jgi:hypothetical protein